MEKNELNILKHLHTLQTAEHNYRRNREFQIFYLVGFDPDSDYWAHF